MMRNKLIRCGCLCIGLLTSLPASAIEPTTARQAELRNLLKHDCGSCHGLTLKGGLGPSLLAKDLADKPNDYLVSTIQQGRSDTAMPPWQPFITEAETRWLIEKLLKNP
ncbi:MAG: cytochrome c55X [Methyloprofundus sp.]|nr:MAG: cytochrome c55X [Methyloprofundus sp.]